MGLKIVRGMVMAMALLGTGSALAAKAAESTSTSTRRAPGKVSFHKAPSEESPAERARRLKRECKGRPNAGACLGFTSP